MNGQFHSLSISLDQAFRKQVAINAKRNPWCLLKAGMGGRLRGLQFSDQANMAGVFPGPEN